YARHPSNILVMTFTNAAAVEMHQRFVQLAGNLGSGVTFGTFHSIFFRILKFAYNYSASNIISEDKRIAYMKEIVTALRMEAEDEAEFVLSILNEISSIKNDRIDLNHYYAKNCSEDNFKKLYFSYEDRLRQENFIDFDDMLRMTYELLTARKDILSLWQQKYQYILIDEFQDINRVQYDVIRLLAAPNNNLFVVGDDDQSIYRFRGAKPEIMLGFEKDYKDAIRILLDTNYRSTQNIVEAAAQLIKNNKARFDKEIKASHKKGPDIVIKEWDNPAVQNEKIITVIRQHLKKGGAYKDIAILFRTNTGARSVVEKLMEYNIPFQIRDSLPNIFDHWIAKSIFSYMRMAHGDRSRATVLSVINRPNRFIGRECLNTSEIYFDAIKEYYKEKDWMVERLEKLEYDLRMLKRMAPYAAINYIRHGVGYEEYLVDYATSRRMKPEELIEVLDALQESAKDFETMEDWFEHIAAYTEELKQQAARRNQVEDAVSLSTMHSVKGLEYEMVLIPDVNEGVIPHHKAVLDADIEEERRLFYVAVTRAKKYLGIFSTKERYSKAQDPSRFMKEIRERAPQKK
ncbi:MAG: ATP-dependent helicase, partial [Lachnospiraceae bacterium]